jgi:hypothetical protein
MCGTPSSRGACLLLLLLVFMALVSLRADEARPEPLPDLSIGSMSLSEIALMLENLASSLEDNSQRSEQESEALRIILLQAQERLELASKDLDLSEASRIKAEQSLELSVKLQRTLERQIRSLKLQRLGLICLSVLLTILAVVF